MAFIKLEDFSGTIDCVVFASVYMDFEEFIKEDTIFFVKGEIDATRSEPNLKVGEVISLDKATEQSNAPVNVAHSTG